MELDSSVLSPSFPRFIWVVSMRLVHLFYPAALISSIYGLPRFTHENAERSIRGAFKCDDGNQEAREFVIPEPLKDTSSKKDTRCALLPPLLESL